MPRACKGSQGQPAGMQGTSGNTLSLIGERILGELDTTTSPAGNIQTWGTSPSTRSFVCSSGGSLSSTGECTACITKAGGMLLE